MCISLSRDAREQAVRVRSSAAFWCRATSAPVTSRPISCIALLLVVVPVPGPIGLFSPLLPEVAALVAAVRGCGVALGTVALLLWPEGRVDLPCSVSARVRGAWGR